MALVMGESIPRSTYGSKQELIDAGLHSPSSSDAYCKNDPETCVYSVLSGCHKSSRTAHKDMGGLLQEGSRDFLVYRLGMQKSRAMWASKRLGRHVHVIRQVRIKKPLHLTPPVPSESTSHSTCMSYVYCGKYEVLDGWRANQCASCFKLSRLPEQPALVPQQMAFRSNNDGIANSFQLTREAYEFALRRDCTEPCERMNASDGSGIDVDHDAMLAEYCLCDVCGMSGSRSDSGNVKMEVCGTCLDNDKETLACTCCVPWELRCWMREDPDSRHWRCARCRLAGLRPRCGAIFDEQASSTQAYCCEQQTGAASVGISNQQDVIELSDSGSHSEKLKHEVPSVTSGSQHLSHAGRPETPDDIQRKSARIITPSKRFHQAGCSGRQQKRRTEAPSVVKQLDNRQTLAASRLQPATAAAVQVHMHPKLGVSSAQLPAVNDALPTKAGVSMTSAAAAPLMHTSQLPSGPGAKLAMLAAAPSGSLQANSHQASRQLQLQKWPSASKAATVAAPLSALLPSMPMQTTGKPLLPATGALLQVNSLQTTLPAQPSQQEGTATAAAPLHSPSSRLPSLHTSASASVEVPARVSPGSAPAAGALSPLGPAHAPESSPSELQHPQATLLSEQSQIFQTNGMSQTPHAQVSARPTCSTLVPPTQTAGFQSCFVQPQKISPLYALIPATSSSAAAAATAVAVPNQLPFAPAELPSSIAARGTAARVCLPPLQSPPPAVLPTPPVCATEAQGTATTLAPEPKPAAAMPALGTPPQAILANPPLQAPIMSAAPAISRPMRDSALKEGSAESPPRTSPSSANVAMPVCITQVVCRINGLMGPQQQTHHITEAQAAHLDEVFGDVEVLLDLASMDDKPLNRALRCDGKLNAVQIVSMRRLLRTISHQSSA